LAPKISENSIYVIETVNRETTGKIWRSFKERLDEMFV
jgi:hypothetical protein